MTTYRGVIVLESLRDPTVVDGLKVVAREHDEPSGWRLVTVEVTSEQATALASELKSGPWYIHFWHDQDVIVVFKDAVFRLRHNDRSTWTPALNHGRALGIPEEQLDFPIDNI